MARPYASTMISGEGDPAAKRQRVGGGFHGLAMAAGAAGIRATGSGARWNSDRGFGFIEPDGGGDDVFCHTSDIVDGQMLADGAKVEFDMVYEEAKGKYRARNVSGGCPQGSVAPSSGAGAASFLSPTVQGAVNFLSPAAQSGGSKVTYLAPGIRQCQEQAMQSRMVNPTRKSFFICKDIQNGTSCHHGERCNFAHSEEEKQAWTAERDRRVLEQSSVMARMGQGGYGAQQAMAAQYAGYAPAQAASAAVLDPATQQQVAYVEHQLAAAKAAQDYMLCAQLKAQIDTLKSQARQNASAAAVDPAVQQQVAYLEHQLEAAKAAQDYMLCAQLKAQITPLKAQAQQAAQYAAYSSAAAVAAHAPAQAQAYAAYHLQVQQAQQAQAAAPHYSSSNRPQPTVQPEKAPGGKAVPEGRQTGVAMRWNHDRGFGFIRPAGGGEDYFCHYTDIMDGKELGDGAAVEFEPVWDEKRNKNRARNVTGGQPLTGGNTGGEAAGGEDGGGGGGGSRRDKFEDAQEAAWQKLINGHRSHS